MHVGWVLFRATTAHHFHEQMPGSCLNLIKNQARFCHKGAKFLQVISSRNFVPLRLCGKNFDYGVLNVFVPLSAELKPTPQLAWINHSYCLVFLSPPIFKEVPVTLL